MPVPDAAAFPVQPGLDPGLAAALVVAGMADWVALDYRGHLRPGETVLILRAGGTAGQLAVQAVDFTGDQGIDARLAAAAASGYDVIIDFLWDGLAPSSRDEPRQHHADLGRAGQSESP